MNDRFKFRATVKGYYYIDTPEKCEEFEPLIFLENIDVLDIGDIGISEEDLEIAIRKQYPDLQDVYIECILENFRDNSNGIDTYITITPERVYQSTGLKDKNGLNRLFEYDIINGEGIKIGNYYENKDLLKTTTNYLIKRMGTKEWRNSEQEAIKRGCFYAE